MRGRLRGAALSAVVAVAIAGACASEDDPYEAEPMLPEEESVIPTGTGWTWGGEGEPPSYAAADAFCRRFTTASSPRLTAEVEGIQQGTVVSTRVSENNRRTYWSCMEGRGWKRTDGP